MFVKKSICLALLLLAVCFSAFTIATTWKIKAPYEVTFTGLRVSGNFSGLKASIAFDKDHPEDSKISATIDGNTLDAGFFIKTHHAKDALDIENHPLISFTSNKVVKIGNGYEAVGTLNLHGVAKPATIHFTFDDKGTQGLFKGELKIITKEFNISRSGSPDEVTVTLNVPVTK